jgi:Cu/Ag efflux protein CusF
MTSRLARAFVAIAITLAFSVAPAFAQQAGKKEYEFRGKVEKVDAKTKKVTVNGEKVEGWMVAMTMNYKVDKEDTLKSLKAGDQITAKVYDGDVETLYNVQKVAGDAGTSGAKK